MNLEILKLIAQVPEAAKILAAKPAPGIKTTEFYMTSAVSLYAMVSPAVPMPYSILVPAVAVSVYTLVRGVVKLAQAFGKLKDVDLPALPAAPAP